MAKTKTSIAVCSIENSKVVTEKNYFSGNKFGGKSSLKYDDEVKGKFGIHSLMFESFNFFEILKDKSEIVEVFKNKIETVNPKISKVILICDRDKNFSLENMKKIAKVFKGIFKGSVVEMIIYKNDGDCFETFLKLHFKNRKLYSGYKKSDLDVYSKTMYSSKKLNLDQLISNVGKYQSDFKKLFCDHSIDKKLN